VCGISSPNDAVVTDAASEPAVVPGPAVHGSSVETVYNRCLAASGRQSSCPVSVMKLDWESVSDSDLSALAATVDCVIATGRVLILTHPVSVLLTTHIIRLHHVVLHREAEKKHFWF